MDYPYGFTGPGVLAVEAALDEAEIRFRQEAKSRPGHLVRLAIDFAHSVFAVFSQEAHDLVRKGGWNRADLREGVDAFLRKLTSFAYRELPGVHRCVVSGNVSWDDDAFHDYIVGKLKASDVWLEHLRRGVDGPRPRITVDPPTVEFGQGIDKSLKAHRLAILKQHLRERDWKVKSVAQHLGISRDTYYGVINEDASRCTVDSRDKLLKEFGLSAEDWYQHRQSPA